MQKILVSWSYIRDTQHYSTWVFPRSSNNYSHCTFQCLKLQSPLCSKVPQKVIFVLMLGKFTLSNTFLNLVSASEHKCFKDVFDSIDYWNDFFLSLLLKGSRQLCLFSLKLLLIHDSLSFSLFNLNKFSCKVLTNIKFLKKSIPALATGSYLFTV